jgi:hypothetical protein
LRHVAPVRVEVEVSLPFAKVLLYMHDGAVLAEHVRCEIDINAGKLALIDRN